MGNGQGAIHQIWLPPWMTKVLGSLAGVAIISLTTAAFDARDQIRDTTKDLAMVKALAEDTKREVDARAETIYSVGVIRQDVATIKSDIKELSRDIKELLRNSP